MTRMGKWANLAGFFVALGWLTTVSGIEVQAQETAQAQLQPGRESEIDELKKQVQELQKRIGVIEGERAQLETKAATPPGWTQKIRIFGDMGIRAEIMHNVAHLTGTDTYRTRYRLRINGAYQVNEYWETGFRIMNADPRYPTTGWETFGQTRSPGDASGPESGSGRSGFVNFDRMYINWTPNRWVKIQTGKQELPFWKPWMVWGSSVWHDDDLQPAGFAEVFRFPAFGSMKSMKLVFSQFALSQMTTSTTNLPQFQTNGLGSSMWGAQLSGVVAATPDLDVGWGIGFYAFDNLNGFAKGIPQAMTAGTYNNRSTNTVLAANPSLSGGYLNCSPFAGLQGAPTAPNNSCNRYLSEWRLVNAGVELHTKGRVPIIFSADVVNNFGAVEDKVRGAGKRGLAWEVHASVGSFREPGEFQFGAGYYWGQADATWAVWADDDYLNTNVNTAMFNIKWKIFKDVLLVWDNYIRRWNDSQLAELQGIVPADGSGNATFSSSRLTWVVSF